MAEQTILIVHHGDAVGPEVDTRRPLSARGRECVNELAATAATRGVRPAEIWHSGKLRTRDTAARFRERCNPLASFTAVRGLQPTDPVETVLQAIQRTNDDLVVVGHLPHLPRLLRRLLGEHEDHGTTTLPLHGMVAVVSSDRGVTWREAWRVEEPRSGRPADIESER